MTLSNLPSLRASMAIFMLGVSLLTLPGCFEEDGDSTREVSVPIKIHESASIKLETPVRLNKKSIVQPRDTIAGHYLSSQFAQSRKDWKKALKHIDYIVNKPESNGELVRMSMVLAAGSGDIKTAIANAQTLASKQTESDDGSAQAKSNALAPLFRAIGFFKDKKYTDAEKEIDGISHGGLGTFVKPFMKGWNKAAQGKIDIDRLTSNTIHLNHAVMIADYLNQKDKIPELLAAGIGAPNISLLEVEDIANAYAYIGETEKASTLFEEILKDAPDEKRIQGKLQTLKDNKPLENGFKPAASPQDGMARAMSDMAILLYREGSDDSARVFAQIALYLNKDLNAPWILLGEIDRTYENYETAIESLENVSNDYPNYLDIRRQIAELYEQIGDKDHAMKELQTLADEQNDYQSLITIGDILRTEKKYKKAISTYNDAEKRLKKEFGTPPDEFWYLYYVRGMAYEQMDSWTNAEKDLEKALEYRPENPYVLNYLGYAWADQDVNLEKALEMIRTAVALKPTDGYITDSLGWVYYRMGDYENAVAYLETAVALMPYDPTINDHLGDAYWQVGRVLEAKFQWKRAHNYEEDEALKATIEEKLNSGLAKPETEKQASTQSNKKAL